MQKINLRITEINEILKYFQIENCYYNSTNFKIILFLLYFGSNKSRLEESSLKNIKSVQQL